MKQSDNLPGNNKKLGEVYVDILTLCALFVELNLRTLLYIRGKEVNNISSIVININPLLTFNSLYTSIMCSTVMLF